MTAKRHFHCGSGGWTHEDGCEGCGHCMSTGAAPGECSAPAYTDADRCPHHTARDSCAECQRKARADDMETVSWSMGYL